MLSDFPLHQVRLASYEEAREVAVSMRAQDWNEIYAATSGDPVEEILEAWLTSPVSLVVSRGEEPLLLFGVAQALAGKPRWGIPWLIWKEGSDRDRCFRKFVGDISEPILQEISRFFTYLENWAAGWNRVTLTWLKRLGFSFDPPAPLGSLGVPFVRFHRGQR